MILEYTSHLNTVISKWNHQRSIRVAFGLALFLRLQKIESIDLRFRKTQPFIFAKTFLYTASFFLFRLYPRLVDNNFCQIWGCDFFPVRCWMWFFKVMSTLFSFSACHSQKEKKHVFQKARQLLGVANYCAL